ncbi:unnamed protein product [Brachionus calyciflorus]|uniref:EGF-like domain-containing protein n=1 Tax=Brachionus calyciflorus TaxID=104777 RepID=A0A814GIL2_9BILA|nr:unnamed protein product [Brachionus calyciflorus]
MSRACRFLSGSSSDELILWQNTTKYITYDSFVGDSSYEVENIKSIDSLFEFFITASEDDRVMYWNLASIYSVKKSNIKFDKLRSVLVINETTCLAGYKEALSFLSLPQLEEKKKIPDSDFGDIESMMHLREERIVFIGTSEKKIFVLSLVNEKIISFIDTEIKIEAIDSLNRNIIISGCEFIKDKEDICSYFLNSTNHLVKNKTAKVDKKITSIKIINPTFLVFGMDDKYLGKWDLVSIDVQKISVNEKIHSIEILDNNTFLTGDECGKIDFWNIGSLTIQKTVLSSSKISVLKNIDFEFTKSQSKITSTTTTSPSTTSTSTTTTSPSTTSTSTTSTSPSTTSTSTTTTSPSTTYNLEISTINFMNYDWNSRVSFLSSNLLDTTPYQSLSSFLKPEGKKASINIFNDMKLILNVLDSKSDINDCLTNCSGHGQCKLSKDFKFICECFENYAGSDCSLITLPCSSNPCLNNGTCINNLTDSSYTCDCQRDFYFGKNCEFKKDVCVNETCSKNGNCYDENNKAKCFDLALDTKLFLDLVEPHLVLANSAGVKNEFDLELD